MKILDYTCSAKVEASICLQGNQLNYTAQVDTASFEEGAQIMAFCYEKKTEQPENRPVLFATNGGPGSSSVWLHLGLLGPKRVHMDDAVNPPTVPPYELEDNPNCPLDVCDVVLMDPPATGLSAPAGEKTAPEMYSVDGDAMACALFMETWLQRHHRTNSPIYFAAESYGTVRAGAIADALMGGPFSEARRQTAVSLSGVILLGTALSTADTNLGKPAVEPQAFILMSAAAASAYHHPERFGSVEKAAQEAWDFTPDYVAAVFRGKSLPEQERKAVLKKLSRFTCIPEEQLDRQGLRFTADQMEKAVVPGYQIGAYDGRYLMKGTANPGSKPFPNAYNVTADDPAMGMYTPAFIGGMNLLREWLPMPEGIYSAINFAANFSWKHESARTSLHSLENAMRRNPSMRMFFGSGLLDLCTYPAMVRYLMQQSSLPEERTFVREYAAGHMAYLGDETGAALGEDIRLFVTGKMNR